MSKIAVIGAAGYVGQFLLPLLKARGHQVLAVSRANGRILLAKMEVAFKQAEELNENDRADVVINLAFSKSYSAAESHKDNLEIRSLIDQLVHKHSRMIHLSSLAVFGFRLDRPQITAPLNRKRDYLYPESKTEMEQLLLSADRKQELHIVRCGNIWGPASVNWCSGLADALLYEQPTRFQETGYSNITDVHNLAHYLAFLAENESNIRFHHLAELGAIPWHKIIDFLAETIDVRPFDITHIPFYPSSPKDEWLHLFHPRPDVFLKRLSRSRFFHREAQAMVKAIPDWLKKAVRKEPPTHSPANPVLSWVLSCPVLFLNHTDAGWSPPLKKEESFIRVRNWLQHAGYIL